MTSAGELFGAPTVRPVIVALFVLLLLVVVVLPFLGWTVAVAISNALVGLASAAGVAVLSGSKRG